MSLLSSQDNEDRLGSPQSGPKLSRRCRSLRLRATPAYPCRWRQAAAHTSMNLYDQRAQDFSYLGQFGRVVPQKLFNFHRQHARRLSLNPRSYLSRRLENCSPLIRRACFPCRLSCLCSDNSSFHVRFECFLHVRGLGLRRGVLNDGRRATRRVDVRSVDPEASHGNHVSGIDDGGEVNATPGIIRAAQAAAGEDLAGPIRSVGLLPGVTQRGAA